MQEEERYFGSVRFFKNMILLFFLVCILVPTVFAFYWSARAKRAEAERDAAEEQSASQAQRLQKAEQTAAGLSGQLAEQKAQQKEIDRLLSSETPDYQSLYPDFYAGSPLPDAVETDGVIYLTFDDGPSVNTEQVLSILDEKNVKATFFVVGKSDETSIARMKEIAAAGHTLGMHSYSHEYATVYASVEDFLADFYKLFVLLRDEVGVTPTVFRFPGGSLNNYDSGIYEEIIAEMLRRGFRYYDWNLSAQDAASPSPSAEEILDGILPYAPGKKRAVVLMHDSASCRTTVEALPTLIDELRDMGFTFDRLDRSVKPVTFAYRWKGGGSNG